MSTIIELKSSNVKKLTAVSILPPESGAIVIGGKNGQGKSSVLDSILYALDGKSSMPQQPVRTGQDQATIEIKINSTPPLLITRKIKSDGKATLELKQVQENGVAVKLSKPQAILDALVGSVAFDPLAFTRMKTQDQVELLKKLVGVCTLDIDSEIEELSEVRKTKKQTLASYVVVTEQTKFHAGIPPHEKPLGVATITEELSTAQAHNQSIQDQADLIEKARGVIATRKQDITNLEQQIRDLTRKRDEKLGELLDIESDFEENEKAYAEMKPIDLQPILEKSVTILQRDQQIQDNLEYNKRIAHQTAETKVIDELTAKIEGLRADKVTKMSQAKWPVEGLGFAATGVTYTDLPFEQCSSAEQLKISTAIGLAQNPQLKLMIIRDGSLLDEDNLALLHNMAIEHNAQVWIERVSRGDECLIIMEDGSISTHVEAA